MTFNFKEFTEKQEEVKIVLIDTAWYRERYVVPETQNPSEQDILIEKWIQNATEQIDSICDGRLSIEIPYFNPSDKQDAKELAIVQSCIGDWVEYFILTGKAFADIDKNIASSVPYDLRAKSEDGNIEAKRRDILRKLATTRFYKTIASTDIARTSGSSLASNYIPILDENSEEFLALYNMLRVRFLSTEGDNKMNSNVDFSLISPNNTLSANRQILGSSHIRSSADMYNLPEAYYPGIYGYKFYGKINNAIQADKVLFDNEYFTVEELVDKKGLAFFGDGLDKAITKEETFNLLLANNLIWRDDFIYTKDVLIDFTYEVDGKTYLGKAQSLVNDNIGNNPNDSPNEWKILDTLPIDITEIVNASVSQIEPKLGDIIETKLDELPTVDYVSEYSNQIIPFNSEDDFQSFLTQTKTSASDYSDVMSNYVDVSSNQEIDGEKYFVGDGTRFVVKMFEIYSNETYLSAPVDKPNSITNKQYVDNLVKTTFETYEEIIKELQAEVKGLKNDIQKIK
ncbi:MAG: hypothetical protein ACRCUM_00085 [Mycoplasmoidaceae bacterium]